MISRPEFVEGSKNQLVRSYVCDGYCLLLSGTKGYGQWRAKAREKAQGAAKGACPGR